MESRSRNYQSANVSYIQFTLPVTSVLEVVQNVPIGSARRTEGGRRVHGPTGA